ncbi:MAG: OsmC family protein [Acidiferrobacteraceae bacterium]
MRATVRWVDGMRFSGISETGHEVVMDGAPEYGGRNQGPRPMELVLLGMGGCTAFDVVHILKKGRQPVEGCEAVLEAERAPADPKVFTRIHVHFVVRGHGLNVDQVARAISLSSEKYCSASIMLGKTARMTHDFEIIETAGS